MKRSIPIVLVLSILCSAESCDDKKVKKAFREWNVKTGKAVVACNAAWDEIYKAEADKHTNDIIKEHGDDPAWTDEMAKAEFEKRMAAINEHNARFEDSMVTISNTMEALEQSLDAADHFDKPAFGTIARGVKDVLKALSNVIDIISNFSQDAENEKLNVALNWVEIAVKAGNSLMDLVPVDPDDPTDD